ncbi:hypothetical protein N7486_002340 [Penicillium sp. IBT 16267x]|nr:hypothetical protein N7486_002340 [Penicillium sp. IBT 16267x]
MNIARLYARTGTAVQRLLPTQTSRSLLYRPTKARNYATTAPPAAGLPGHHPHARLYLILAAVGVPAAFWLSRRPNPKPISTFEERHGLNPEYRQAREADEDLGRDPDYCEVRS